MVGQKFKDISWTNLGDVGSLWKLLSFEQSEEPSWENYWVKEREYWGADEPDHKRMKHYFGNEKPEEKLLEKSKKGFKEFLEYLLHWNGLCKINEVIQVIPIQPNVLVLSKNWKGEISDHSDLEVWLKEEMKYFVLHNRYCCEIYSFGTLFVHEDSLEAKLGEQPGSKTVSHRLGLEKDKNEPVQFNPQEKIIKISDAVFKIIK